MEQLLWIILGIVLTFLFNILIGDRIKERYSVEKEDTKHANHVTTKAKVKVGGFFSFKGNPIYLHNEGVFNNIEISENQIDKISIVNIDPSNAVLIPQKSLGDFLDFTATGSGATNVVASIDDSFRIKNIGLYRTKDGSLYDCHFIPRDKLAQAIGPLPPPGQVGARGVAYEVSASNAEEAKELLAEKIGPGDY